MRKAFAPPAIHFKGTGWAKKERASASRTKASAATESSGDKSSSDTTDKAPKAEPATPASTSEGGD